MDYDLPALRERLVQTYTDPELRDLCFELRVDYEIIDGSNKSDKARELLTYLDRRGRLPELVLLCQEQRPNVYWNLILSQKRQSEEFRQLLNLSRDTRSKYLDLRFELYRNVWQSLYALKLAGDDLWRRASTENLVNFAAVYQRTRALVMTNAILFRQEDFDDLEAILCAFGEFEVGKTRLIRFRANDPEHEGRIPISGEWRRVNISEYTQERISKQIQRNSKIKAEYEALLDRIQDGFRAGVVELIV